MLQLNQATQAAVYQTWVDVAIQHEAAGAAVFFLMKLTVSLNLFVCIVQLS